MFSNRKDRYKLNGQGNSKRFRWLKLTGIILLSLFLIFASCFIIFKNDLLQWALRKAKHKALTDYQSELAVQDCSINGFTSIHFNGLSLKPIESDTLISVKSIDASINLWPLFLGKIRLSSLHIEGGRISLVRYDTAESNFKNFIAKQAEKEPSELPAHEVNFAKSAYKIINKLMAQIPSHFEIKECSIGFKNIDNNYILSVDQSVLDNEVFDAKWGFTTPQDTQQWSTNGTLSPSDMTADVKIRSTSSRPMVLPILNEKFNLILGADEVQLKLDEVDYSGDELDLKCFASYKNLLVNHKRLADHDIKVQNGSGKFHFIVGENYAMLDSSSTVSINKILVNPYLRYQRSPFELYAIKLNTPKMSAQDFFNSLPDGMFESLNGIQTEGSLSYSMNFELNDTCPRKVIFESELKPENFRIKSWGTAYIPKINSSFTYIPYEYGRPQRPIEVGSANSYFTPIDEISPYLRNAVLSSEDPSFYSHRGFVMESIRGSIAQNYISKRFARGASTISMQLVKNIFLSRQKTMTRKFEEMLLVWLIENLSISSKHRMFEVYLNIIEWGPSIYGIGEASNFYFNKMPSDITLPEAIYLSAIIPRPKGFMWNFNDSTGLLKPHMERYIKNLSRIMAGRRLVNEEDTAALNTEVKLTGNARNFLKKYKNNPDTTESEYIPADDWDMHLKEELEEK